MGGNGRWAIFGKSFTLFKLFGFAVRVDLSWLLILGLVVWSLAGGVFPAAFPELSWQAHLVMGLTGAAGLFLSIIFHELCHSLVARRFGLPMTGITLFLFGGVAEMADEPPSAKAEFWMAIAGPAASVLVAAVFLGGSFLLAGLAVARPAVAVVRWVGYINILLVAFNLIPGFPLDGGRVLRSVLWHFGHDLRKATRTASRVGAGFGAVLIGLGFLSLLLANPLGGLWWILIGLFIRGAARQGYQQVLVRQFLRGEPISRFMNDQPVTVPEDISVQQFVEDYVYRHHHKMFPVMREGRLVGCVTTREVQEVPRDQWARQSVGQIAKPCGQDNSVRLDQDALHALTFMTRHGLSRALVVDDGELAGILSLKDLSRFLALKLELETQASALPKPPMIRHSEQES